MTEYFCLITTDGDFLSVGIDGDKLLEGLQRCVGGYVETVRPKNLPWGYLLVVNEEGAINGMRYNKCATALYGFPIFGNAVVAMQGERYGEPSDIVGVVNDPEMPELFPILIKGRVMELQKSANPQE